MKRLVLSLLGSALLAQAAAASPVIRLDDQQLSTIRAGQASSTLAAHMRDLAHNQLTADTQGIDRISSVIFDNWFATTGSQLIAANILGPPPIGR